MVRPAQIVALAAALLAGAPARAAEPDEVDRGWTAVSPNAEHEAQQAASAAGCRLEVRHGQTVEWARERCLGDKGDLHFVSNDGQDLIVVFAFPSRTGEPRHRTGLELVRRGETVRRLEVGKFVADDKTLIHASKHFYWVEGALGQPGVPPGYSKDGRSVELTTLDRRGWSVGFDGTVKKIAMPKPLGR